jgi:hypothetical protein
MASTASRGIVLDNLFQMFRDRGVVRLFIKRLAPNDNSKNQIYLGGDFSVLGVLPSGDLAKSPSTSLKPGRRNRQILKAPIRLTWLDSAGKAYPAPHSQLILYPQYPEVRLSGVVQGSGAPISTWLDSDRDGRTPGRILFIGVSTNGDVTGYLTAPDSGLDRQLDAVSVIGTFGALVELEFLRADPLGTLLAQLRRIHDLGWITGKRLQTPGKFVPCDGQNCGGYTLEAELGVQPNGLAEPDYLGWEIKTFTVREFDGTGSAVITVMTPEPDGGIYCDRGPETFVRTFGYPDRKGRPDRINFGGVHKFGLKHPRTGLQLVLTGYDTNAKKILDVDGGIELTAGYECTASWSYKKLIQHWKAKHEKAAYVPNTAKLGPPRSYWFADSVGLGEGAEFDRLLLALALGNLYYDPSLKLVGASSRAPVLKRRNQFRIKYRHVGDLYSVFRQTEF